MAYDGIPIRFFHTAASGALRYGDVRRPAMPHVAMNQRAIYLDSQGHRVQNFLGLVSERTD